MNKYFSKVWKHVIAKKRNYIIKDRQFNYKHCWNVLWCVLLRCLDEHNKAMKKGYELKFSTKSRANNTYLKWREGVSWTLKMLTVISTMEAREILWAVWCTQVNCWPLGIFSSRRDKHFYTSIISLVFWGFWQWSSKYLWPSCFWYINTKLNNTENTCLNSEKWGILKINISHPS